MNCQEALELLYDYIDKEASDIDRKQVQEHLDGCRHCFERYRLEGSIQDFLNEKTQKLNETPKLDSLRARVVGKLDSIDREKSASDQGRPPFFRLVTILALAASVVLVFGAVTLVSDYYRHNSNYMPFEQAHLKAASGSHELGDGSPETASATTILESLQYALKPQVSGYELIGSHCEHILGLEMAHCIYRNGDRCISVLVADANAYQIPDHILDRAVERDGLILYDHTCRTCQLVFHRSGNAVIITASSDQSIDLLSFVPGLVTA